MCGSVLAFSTTAIAGREIGTALDTFELLLYRQIIGLGLIAVIATATGSLGQISAAHFGLHVKRNLWHYGGMVLWYWALLQIPLAELFALEFTTPLWVMLLAPLLLAERLTGMRILSALIGFGGILIVARPDLGHPGAGILAALGSAVGFALSAIYTKQLTSRTTILSILFWLSLIQAIFGLAITGHDGIIRAPSAAILPWLLVLGGAGLIAHYCLTRALSLAPATFVVPLDFMRLPLIALVGMLFYAEPLDALVLLGAAVIFGAGYLNLMTEARNRGKSAFTPR